jgi:kumamolisin
MPEARSLGRTEPSERLEVSVLVRHRGGDALKDRVANLTRGERSDRHLSREEFAQQFGADPADIAAVRQFANTHGLVVVEEDAARRTIVLSGTVAQFNDAFEIDLQTFEHPGGTFAAARGWDACAGLGSPNGQKVADVV